jgi:hypothetical protein
MIESQINNSKWEMQTHFQYMHSKTFLMLLLGSNLDNVYYLQFCSKSLKLL